MRLVANLLIARSSSLQFSAFFLFFLSLFFFFLGGQQPQKQIKTTDNRSYTTLIKQAWFLGIAIGALSMSIIIDNYGRKAGILIGESMRLVANLLIARSSSLQFSAWLRVLVAAGHELAQKSAYIYVIEVVGGEKRGRFGMSFIFFYSFGYASLSAIAYILPYWRDFMMFLGLVSLVPIATLYREEQHFPLKILKVFFDFFKKSTVHFFICFNVFATTF